MKMKQTSNSGSWIEIEAMKARFRRLEREISRINHHDLLLPCPFCGGEAIVEEASNSDEYIARCTNCSAQSACAQTKQAAAELWNSRDDQVIYSRW